MKTAYLSMDMFFNLLDEVTCIEARLVVEKMMATIDGIRECADDVSCESQERRDGLVFAADQFQEALEDYLCVHSSHQGMMDRPINNPSSN